MENFSKYNEIILTFYSLPWITVCKFQKNWSTRRKVIAWKPVSTNNDESHNIMITKTRCSYFCPKQRRGVICETCDQWYHAGCQNIHTLSYDQLGDSELNISWHCIICSHRCRIGILSRFLVQGSNGCHLHLWAIRWLGRQGMFRSVMLDFCAFLLVLIIKP
jgi:hypothetical protein